MIHPRNPLEAIQEMTNRIDLDQIGRRLGVAVAGGALVLSNTGCASEGYTISPENIGVLENVAGACVVDGAKIRADFPMPTADGKPSNVELAEPIAEADFDKTPKNGVQEQSIHKVAKDLAKVVCFNIPSGEIPFVTTTTTSGKTRYWYKFSKDDLTRVVDETKQDKLKTVIDALDAKGLAHAVVASDGAIPASKLGMSLKQTFPAR